jgi:hypothetical protein
MAGKKGPKENSWTMCERFITDVSVFRNEPTMMIGVLKRHVTVSQRGDMEIGRDLFDLDTTVNSTGWSVDHFLSSTVAGVLSFLL